MLRFLTPELPSVAEIERYFARSRERNWFANGGPCYELLAERLSARLGGEVHCVPVANCTLGLMIALRALVRHESEAPIERGQPPG